MKGGSFMKQNEVGRKKRRFEYRENVWKSKGIKTPHFLVGGRGIRGLLGGGLGIHVCLD
jgi:hypothetical protein